MKWIGFIKGPQTALFLFVICYLCFHIVSLLFLLLSCSDFLSQIMQGYFSLSSSRPCIFNFLHMICLLVSLDSSPPSPPYLLFFVSSSTHIQLSLLSSLPCFLVFALTSPLDWSCGLCCSVTGSSTMTAPGDTTPTALPLPRTPKWCCGRLLSPAEPMQALVPKPSALKKRTNAEYFFRCSDSCLQSRAYSSPPGELSNQ